MALQHLRSGTANKRPIPTAMSDGQLAVNTNLASPGLFFKDSNGDLVKAGPVHVGTTAPNASPASTAATALVANTVYQILTIGTSDFTAVGASANTVGVVFTASGTTTGTGTVSGQQGNEKGEQWLDTTNSLYVMKVYDGTGWRVTDSISLANGSAAAPSLHFGSDTNTGLFRSAADELAVTTGGTQRVVVDSSGNVGIGTTSPAKPLHIADTVPLIRFEDTNNSNALLDVSGSGGDCRIDIDSTSLFPASRFSVDIDGSERLRIDSSGRLLVGTSSTTSNNIFVAQGATAGAGGQFAIARNNNTPGTTDAISNLNFATSTHESVAQIQTRRDGGTWTADTSYPSALVFSTTADGASSPSERLRIDSSGNVGIGTTSPSNLLTVDGEAEFTEKITVKTGATGSTLWLKNGSSSSSASTSRLNFGNTEGTGSIEYHDDLNHYLSFKVNDDEIVRMKYEEEGNEGLLMSVGMPVAEAMLTVKDSGFFANENNSGTPHIKLEKIGSGNSTTGKITTDSLVTTGNVGIGVTSPTELLEVHGDTPSLKLRDTSGYAAETGPAIRFQGKDSSEVNRQFSAIRGISKGGDNGQLAFDTRAGGINTERMRLDNLGRLLVGTSNDISGSTNRLLQVVAVNNAGIIAVGRNDQSVSSGNTLGKIEFYGNEGNTYHEIADITVAADDTHSATDKPTRITFSTTGDNLTSSTERMRIDSSGNIGIGLTSISNSRKVEILQPSSYDAALRIKADGNGNDGVLQWFSGLSQYGIGITQGTDALKFQRDGSEKMRIDSSGRLLVGTSSAISGSGAQDNLQLVNSAGSILSVASSDTTIGSGTRIGEVQFWGLPGSTWGNFASIGCFGDGTATSNDNPGRLGFFTTADGAPSPTERLRIDSSGKLQFYGNSSSNWILSAASDSGAYSQIDAHFPTGNRTLFSNSNTANDSFAVWNRNSGSSGKGFGLAGQNFKVVQGSTEQMRIDSSGRLISSPTYSATSGSSGNVGISSNGKFFRSTSSSKYKTDIETLEDSYSDALLNCRPVWYHSLCADDNPEHGFWGFIAEEVAEIDPRLVFWKTTEVTYDDKGAPVETPCDPEPEGVAYDRFVPHLVNLLKRQKEQIETLEQRLSDAGIA